jgi:hypothetical protein
MLTPPWSNVVASQVRKALDDAYRKIGIMTRTDLESMWSPNRWLLEGSNDEYNPEERQHNLADMGIVKPVAKLLKSKYAPPPFECGGGPCTQRTGANGRSRLVPTEGHGTAELCRC